MDTVNQPLSNQGLFDLQIDQENTSYLNETARWGKFLSIVGFVFIGIFTLVFLVYAFSGSSYESLYQPLWQRTVGPMFMIILLISYFFPCLYLLNYSNKMKYALRGDDQEQLLGAFRNLKACLRFVGIITIVMLCINVITILFVIVRISSL